MVEKSATLNCAKSNAIIAKNKQKTNYSELIVKINQQSKTEKILLILKIKNKPLLFFSKGLFKIWHAQGESNPRYRRERAMS